MSVRLRSLAALVIVGVGLALPAPASAAPACSATDATFCVSYSADVLSAQTGLPTTQSLEPVNLRLGFTNTSASYRDQAGQSRWLSKLSATLLSSGAIRPVVTASANLPDGLLVGGDPSASLCGAGADYTFSTCTAGHGVAYAKVTSNLGFLFPSGVYTATYGIQQITNVKTTSHFAVYRATLAVCLQYNGSKCFQQVSQTQDVTLDLPAAGQPMAFDFVLPTNIPSGISGVTVDRFTVDTLSLYLKGASTKLADGSTVPWQNVVRLPQTCGPVDAGATLTDVAGATVSFTQPLGVTGCTTLTASAAGQITYGTSTVLSGRLTDTQSGAPVVNRKLVLRQCPVGLACQDVNAVLTSSTGNYAFTVKPGRNTTYTVSDKISHRSVSRTVKVAPTVGLAFDKSRMNSGGTLTLSGAVAPNHAGRWVVVQRLVNGTWQGVSSAQLTSSSTYSKAIRLSGTSGSRAYLRVVLAADTDHAAGVSATRSVLFN